MRITGIILCLASAAAFGAMGVFGKLAYEQGSTVATLLSTRFVVAGAGAVAGAGGHRRRSAACARSAAATCSWPWGSARWATAPRPAATSPRSSAWTRRCWRWCSTRSPSWWPWPRSRWGATRPARAPAVALVLAGSRPGAGAGRRRGGLAASSAATALGLGAAAVYTVYILTSEGIASRVDSLALATLVCTGAAVTLTAGGPDHRRAGPGRGHRARLAVAGRAGAWCPRWAPSRCSSPACAGSARPPRPSCPRWSRWSRWRWPSAVFGESLGPVQLAGGALVLLAAVAVRVPDRLVELTPTEVAREQAA